MDNLSTPKAPELVPPLTLLAPWCLKVPQLHLFLHKRYTFQVALFLPWFSFQALQLSDEYHRGKILACALLCDITLLNQDIKVDQEYLCKFYATIHRCIIINNQVSLFSINPIYLPIKFVNISCIETREKFANFEPIYEH